MKNHVQLFEEFISNPVEETALLKQFTTGKTHSVSVIVSDENGIHVEPVGGKTPIPPQLSVSPEGTM